MDIGGMDIAGMEFSIGENDLLAKLYSQNLYLSARVDAMEEWIMYLLTEKTGLSKEDVEKIWNQSFQEHIQESVTDNPDFNAWWTKKVKAELGDIQGINYL